MVQPIYNEQSYTYHVGLEIPNILPYLLYHFFLKYFKVNYSHMAFLP